jgi:type IV secretory pathway VirB10-like protein
MRSAIFITSIITSLPTAAQPQQQPPQQKIAIRTKIGKFKKKKRRLPTDNTTDRAAEPTQVQQQLQPEEDHDAEPAQPQQQQSPQQQQPPEQQATQEVEPDTGAEQPEMDHDAAVTEDAEPVAAAPRKKKRYRGGSRLSQAQRKRAKQRAQAAGQSAKPYAT